MIGFKCLLLCASVALAAPAEKRNNGGGSSGYKYDSIILTGDSYTDNCNSWRLRANASDQALYPFPKCPPAPTGRADGGRQWPELLQDFAPDLNIINLAYSGATCDNTLFDRSPLLDVGEQIEYLQANVSAPDKSKTLVGIYIGTNDMSFLVNGVTGNKPPSNPAPGADLLSEVTCVLSRVKTFYDNGYKNQLIFQNIPLQSTPSFYNTTATNKNGTLTAQAVQDLVGANNALQGFYIQEFNAKYPDANIQIFPTYNLYQELFANPSAYLGDGAIGGSSSCDLSAGYVATQVNVCQNYVLANSLHPSQATGYILAKQVQLYLQGGQSGFTVFPYSTPFRA